MAFLTQENIVKMYLDIYSLISEIFLNAYKLPGVISGDIIKRQIGMVLFLMDFIVHEADMDHTYKCKIRTVIISMTQESWFYQTQK